MTTTEDIPAATPTHAPDAGSPRSARRGLLTNIQAMRALAVTLVLVYHLRPDLLTGGFVGVDVFFVISGYLMTAHLLRKTRPGDSVRTAVLDFYSRRIRRILPASLLVLIVVAFLVLVGVSRVEWGLNFDEIRASALYYQNWQLASTATNYLAGSVTSPVEHFWSLSVEEQFYLGWPLLLATLGILLGKWGRRAQLAAIVLILVGSLVYSVHITDVNPSVAYFSTFARLWEFAVGGILAWLNAVGKVRGVPAAVLGWAGLAAIGYSALQFNGYTAFPGYLAGVPVVGAAAVLASGERSVWWGPHAVMRWRPVQYVGDISYSVYLWHMPLIVLYPEITNRSMNNSVRLAIVALTVLLSALTKKFVEDPFRRRAPRTAPMTVRARPFAVCAVLMVIPVLISVGALASVHRQENSGTSAYAAVTANPPACYGAATIDGLVPGCTPQTVTLRSVVPSPFAATEGFEAYCQQVGGVSTVRTCTFGSAASTATRVAVAGDSHITHWLPALREIAAARGWRVTTYLKAGCAFTALRALDPDCVAWNTNVTRELARGRYTYVLVSARSNVYHATAAVTRSRVQGLVDAWRSVEAVGSTIIAIRDVPQPTLAGRGSIPVCVADHGAASCGFDRQRSEALDLIAPATLIDRKAALVDLNADICPGTTCRAVVGNVLVYADDSHLTATYVRSMTPAISRALTAAGMP